MTDLKPSPSFLPSLIVIEVVSHLYVGPSSWVLHYKAQNTVSQRADPTDYLQLSLSQRGEGTPPLQSTSSMCSNPCRSTEWGVAMHYQSHQKDPQVFLPSICCTLVHTTGTHGTDCLWSNNITQLVHKHSPLLLSSDPQTNTEGRIKVWRQTQSCCSPWAGAQLPTPWLLSSSLKWPRSPPGKHTHTEGWVGLMFDQNRPLKTRH